ncbi:MAG: YesL family protein [Lachnospiraceae bacterium]|nr:YesL family protein [Lachnospiraceae bacterium]
MSSFFNSDNKFFSTLGKVFDLMLLSVMWFILSAGGMMLTAILIGKDVVKEGSVGLVILIVLAVALTLLAGPASTAFYYTIVKVIRRERSYMFKEFIRSFKLNFRQGILLALVYIIFAALMIFDVDYARQLSEQGSKYGSVLYGVFLVVGIFVLFTMIYAFPLLSRFTVTIKHLFKWSFYLSIRHIGWTLLMVVMFACTVIIMYFSFFAAPPLLIILPGVYTLLLSLPMEKVLKKYMPKDEGTAEEDGVDRWYNE